MKKLVISIATISAAMATGVSAETFEGSNDLNLALTGEVDIAYAKSTTEDAEGVLGFDDVKMGVMPSYTNADGVKAFANFEVEFAEALEANPALALNNAYVGIGISGAELTVGKQDLASGDFGVGHSIAFGPGSQLAATSGNDVVKGSYELDGLKVVASYDISESEDETAIDLYGEYTLMDSATVAATFQSHKANPDADALNYMGVSGEYELDAMSVAAEFSYDVDAKNMGYEVAGAYDVTSSISVAAGIGQTLYDNDAVDTLTQYYANAEYKIHENATTYVEVGGNSLDNSEIGYVVGMNVKF